MIEDLVIFAIGVLIGCWYMGIKQFNKEVEDKNK